MAEVEVAAEADGPAAEATPAAVEVEEILAVVSAVTPVAEAPAETGRF